MNAFLLALRYLLALCCACACLYALSFPHNIIPPDPNLEGLPFSWSLYDVRDWLWVLPFFMWELVSMAGPRRNVIWFSSMLTVLVGGLLAWPLLDAYYPELLWKSFDYEDGRISLGLGYFAILFVVSCFFRLLILNYFFSIPPDPYEDNDIGLMELDIANAKTVQEIAASAQPVRARFLFGEADKGLIARFYQRARAMLRLRRNKQMTLFVLALVGLAWFFIAPLILSSPAQAQARDWERMYETTSNFKGSRIATTPAVYAAYRILSQISQNEALAGMTPQEAEDYLRLQDVSDSYRQQLRDESDLKSGSAEDIFASRTRFLTISDGRRRVILFVRKNADGSRINICELQDEGWNRIIDRERQRIGSDWRSNVINR